MEGATDVVVSRCAFEGGAGVAGGGGPSGSAMMMGVSAAASNGHGGNKANRACKPNSRNYLPAYTSSSNRAKIPSKPRRSRKARYKKTQSD